MSIHSFLLLLHLGSLLSGQKIQIVELVHFTASAWKRHISLTWRLALVSRMSLFIRVIVNTSSFSLTSGLYCSVCDLTSCLEFLTHLLLFITFSFRSHCMHCVDVAYCCACQTVCLYVGHIGEPFNNGWINRVAWTHALDRGAYWHHLVNTIDHWMICALCAVLCQITLNTCCLSGFLFQIYSRLYQAYQKGILWNWNRFLQAM